MKKFLLSAVAIFTAASMNAQVFQMDAESHGLTSDLSDVEAGHLWGTVAGVADISNAFATQHKAVNCKNNDYVTVSFDGNTISTSGGVQGNDNPKDIDGGNPALTLVQAASGAVIQIDAKKNGYAYVVGKLSSNKQYVVFEEGTAVGYKLWMEINDERFPNSILSYELKGEGEYNWIPEGRQIQWAVREALGDVEAATAGNGLGVIGFPIFEGCKYYAHATGSKISWCGIYFSDAEVENITVSKEDGTALQLNAGSSSIKAIAAESKSAQTFNLAGQQVNNNYKGIVIANGRKFINK